MLSAAGQHTDEHSVETVDSAFQQSPRRGACVLHLGIFLGFVLVSDGASAASDVDLVVKRSPSLAQQTASSKVKPRDVRDIVVETERGRFLNVEATVNNAGASESGPFNVRIYLADRYDGSGLVHEFDVVKKLSVPGKGQVLVKGDYVVPFYPVVAGRNYWLVVEADSDKDVAESDEGNNRKVVTTVFVPCDDFKKEDYVDEYMCPKFGEND